MMFDDVHTKKKYNGQGSQSHATATASLAVVRAYPELGNSLVYIVSNEPCHTWCDTKHITETSAHLYQMHRLKLGRAISIGHGS